MLTNDREKRPYVRKVVEVEVPTTAQDFKQYIGEIVNNTYQGCYAEVMAVIDGYVIIKNGPMQMPQAINAGLLSLDFSASN